MGSHHDYAEREFGFVKVRVAHDLRSLARSSAQFASEKIREAVASQGTARVMFATGNSQLAFVDTLTSGDLDVPWRNVEVFHMDEYVGSGADHPAGFQRWIRERISDKVHPAGAHYIDGTADPEVECETYAALLSAKRIDLCCLGIGENAHLAFNDPGVADFEDPLDVKVVELDTACRTQQVNEGHFPDIEAVPKLAITVTIPALLRARTVLAVVPEERKAPAVRRALEGPIEESCPASVLRTCSHAVVYLDDASASLLSATRADSR